LRGVFYLIGSRYGRDTDGIIFGVGSASMPEGIHN